MIKFIAFELNKIKNNSKCFIRGSGRYANLLRKKLIR